MIKSCLRTGRALDLPCNQYFPRASVLDRVFFTLNQIKALGRRTTRQCYCSLVRTDIDHLPKFAMDIQACVTVSDLHYKQHLRPQMIWPLIKAASG